MNLKTVIAVLMLAGTTLSSAAASEAEDYAIMLLVADLVCADLEIPLDLLGISIGYVADEEGISQDAANLGLAVKANDLADGLRAYDQSSRDDYCANVENIAGKWEAMKAGNQ